MDPLVAFLDKTKGRDKCYRGVQYSCLLFRWVLTRRAGGEESFKATAHRLMILERSMSQMRKVLRMGNPLREYLSIKRSLSHPEAFHRAVDTVRHGMLFAYFVLDQAIWLMDMRVLRSKQRERYRAKAMFCAFMQNLLVLAIDIYVIVGRWGVWGKQCPEKLAVDGTTPYVRLLKDLLDLPLATFGYYEMTVSPGIIAGFGIATSLIGGFLAWPRMSRSRAGGGGGDGKSHCSPPLEDPPPPQGRAPQVDE
mmetsp:Transcript_8513/g.24032  ORF Transcript_8513/g.24032 Transcript_8513/m.24032 type:complete len:251 (-) Transcript_8513:176-928(-)